MTPSRSFLALGLVLLAPPASSAQDAPPKVHKLNGPLARRSTRDVAAFRLGPDGLQAYYLADPDRDESNALFRVPADGSGPVQQLSQVLSSNFRVDPDFQIAPQDDRVVYRLSVQGGNFHLWAAATSGGTPPVQLDPFTHSREAVESGFRIGSGGTRVVYLADRTVDGVLELWSARLDGGEPPVRLNGPLPSGGRVLDFQLSPDGESIVYRADQFEDEVFELLSVPLDRSAPPTRLNGPLTGSLTNGGDVSPGYRISPDGTRVVYVADQTTNNTFYVYSIPLDASRASVRLMPANTSQNFQPEFVLTGDGSRVVFLPPDANARNLFGVPVDGSVPAVALTSGLPPAGVLTGFRAGPGGTVLFRAAEFVGGSLHLYAVPADGSAAMRRVDDLADLGGQVLEDFGFGAGGKQVFFRAERGVGQTLQLFAAPLDGSSGPRDLDGPPGLGGDVLGYRERDGIVAYLADPSGSDERELYLVGLDGLAGPVRLSGVLARGGDVQPDFELAPLGARVVYRADEFEDERFELFGAVAGQDSLRLNPPFAPATYLVSSVQGFIRAGERVVYLAPEREFGVNELHSVLVRGGSGPVVLNPTLVPGGQVRDFRITPDVTQVLYAATQDVAGRTELYRVPVDGSSPAVRMSGEMVAGGNVLSTSGASHQISADGRWVVYVADERVDGQNELFAVPLTEDGPSRLLTPLRAARDVLRFRITPDSRHVVYQADAGIDERFELYSVPLDGSAPPVRIGAMQNAGGDAIDFDISADSTRVIYRADQLLNDHVELFLTRVDGLSPSRRLSSPMTSGGEVQSFRLDPSLRHVLYLADQDVRNVYQLFSVPMTGASQLGVELNPPVTRMTKIMDAEFSPDGDHVVYTDRQFHLFGVAADGRTPARLLDGNYPATQGAFSPTVTRDGTRVIYLGNPGIKERFYLLSVPLDGSAAPIRLNPPLIHARRVNRYAFTPDDHSVAFLANQFVDDSVELFLVPTDGSRAPRRLNGPLVAGGSVTGFQFGADENEVLYLADQEQDRVVELFVSFSAPLVRDVHHRFIPRR